MKSRTRTRNWTVRPVSDNSKKCDAQELAFFTLAQNKGAYRFMENIILLPVCKYVLVDFCQIQTAVFGKFLSHIYLLNFVIFKKNLIFIACKGKKKNQ